MIEDQDVPPPSVGVGGQEQGEGPQAEAPASPGRKGGISPQPHGVPGAAGTFSGEEVTRV